MGAVVHRSGEGEHLTVGPSSLLIKVTGDDTAGSFFLSETTLPPGGPGPPPHVHERLHDMFYVLEGVLTMRLGEEEMGVEAGTFVCVPPGVVHAFANRGDRPVRFLNFNTPAGWEGYMRDLAAAAAEAGPLTPQRVGEIASRYDFRPV